MLTYTIQASRGEYLLQESVDLRLRIENRGNAPVEIPDPLSSASTQPLFDIVGPTHPTGARFSHKSVLDAQLGADRPVPALKFVRVDPGSAWEGEIALDAMVDLGRPGEYRMRSVLDWDGVQTRSQALALRVISPRPASIHLGLGQAVTPGGTAEGRCVFLVSGDGGKVLYALDFLETRPDRGEIEMNKPVRQMVLGKDATDIGSPYMNAPFNAELIQWTVWREGRDVKSRSDSTPQPWSVTLPADIVSLVDPPLKTRGGQVESLAVGADGQLTLVSFPGRFKPPAPAPHIGWRVALPAQPVGIAAALASEKLKGERHVVFTAARDDGFEVFHTRYAADSRPEAFQSVRVARLRLLPRALPALVVDSDGQTLVTVLATDETARLVSAVALKFGDTGRVKGAPEVLALGELPASATQGVVQYVDKGDQPIRRDIVVAAAGQGVFASKAGKALAALAVPELSTTTPLRLVQGRQLTYILLADPQRGMSFEPI